MITDADGGGTREFVDGKPVHCGTTLQLRANKGHYDSDGRWIDEPTNECIDVRFEITHVRTWIRDPVACTHCKDKLPRYHCGCKDEPTCCYCGGTGNMAGAVIRMPDDPGSWQSIRTPMLHVVTATKGHEFKAAVHSGMQFRWPRSRGRR